MARKGKRVKAYIPLFFVGWYFYGMFINSIQLGIASTFHPPDAPEIETIWIADPVKNFLAIFSSTGLAVTFFCVLMICLITKKGYNWFSGYKFKRDPRGFDILPDATHGTSGWMDRKEMEQVVDLGSTAEMQGILLGKLKDDPDDDDKYSKYVAPSPENHLNSHIIIYGASGSGKTRGIRTCIHNRRMPDGRGFFPSNKEIFRSHTDVWQGKPTQYGGKKTVQTVCSGCEYRFLLSPSSETVTPSFSWAATTR